MGCIRIQLIKGLEVPDFHAAGCIVESRGGIMLVDVSLLCLFLGQVCPKHVVSFAFHNTYESRHVTGHVCFTGKLHWAMFATHVGLGA